jgi:hypothetical protein
MILKNWSLIVRYKDPYSPPEEWTTCLHGNVYEHPRFDDGKEITTSSIEGKVGDKVKTHSGSLYELQDIDPEYEKIYPNAKERLLKTLKEI